MHGVLEPNWDFKWFLERPTFITNSKGFWENELVAVELIIDLCRLIFPGDKEKGEKILKSDAPGKWKTNGPYFPQGMGGASILFRTDDYTRPAVTSNTRGAPSPATWKHLGNFTEKAEGSARDQTPNLKSTEWWWQCSRVWLCLGFTSTLQDSYSITKLDFLYTCGRKSSDWHWDQNHGRSGTLFSKANLYWIFQFQTPLKRSFNTTDGS